MAGRDRYPGLHHCIIASWSRMVGGGGEPPNEYTTQHNAYQVSSLWTIYGGIVLFLFGGEDIFEKTHLLEAAPPHWD